MSAPEEEEREEEEEAQDLQLSSVCGNGVLGPQTSLPLPEDAEPQEQHEYYPTETLSLSRTKLRHVPESILRSSSLKYLYLEGNQICSIPDSLFASLPSLQWLDLRYNLIVRLPAEIGLHRYLKTLLLEGNPISELQPELGNVITLKGLSLRNCPITFPPQDIVHQGIQGILQYLRIIMAERHVSTRKAAPELPVVEKLQLSDLTGSSVEEQDEDGLQKFKELKDKMILLDRAEWGSMAQGDRNPKSHLHPIIKGKKATTKAGMIPGLLLYDTQIWKRPEERRQAAMKEMKEKQAILEHRRKSQETLQKWQTQARITQEKKMSEQMLQRNGRQKKQKGAEAGVGDGSDAPQRQTSYMSITDCEERRSSLELGRQIRARVEKIQERRKTPMGTTSEHMAAAEQDLEELTKIQTRLLVEGNRSRAKDLDKCFTIYTGDTLMSFLDK
ncbi:leucine-rich repeat-containing protein 27-like [Platichthys flesus]|uniref:leucine-rich repeat-containing protein 27-like n=1 Tax=Platichthys flesus TaxID=8260 RepID=UPI002DBEE0C4|nr:leucine-rich repeat-containing protein 27-like [Platichthys flesus]